MVSVPESDYNWIVSPSLEHGPKWPSSWSLQIILHNTFTSFVALQNDGFTAMGTATHIRIQIQIRRRYSCSVVLLSGISSTSFTLWRSTSIAILARHDENYIIQIVCSHKWSLYTIDHVFPYTRAMSLVLEEPSRIHFMCVVRNDLLINIPLPRSGLHHAALLTLWHDLLWQQLQLLSKHQWKKRMRPSQTQASLPTKS